MKGLLKILLAFVLPCGLLIAGGYGLFKFIKRKRKKNEVMKGVDESKELLMTVERGIAKGKDFVISRLLLNGEPFCYTLEDVDRGLKDSMTLEQIMQLKVKDKTAIPTGKYEIDMDTVSPAFSKKSFYQNIGGKLPRLKGVKGFDGVLMHVGNYVTDSSGCLLVGDSYNGTKGTVNNSKATFTKLYAKLDEAHKQGKKITINIV